MMPPPNQLLEQKIMHTFKSNIEHAQNWLGSSMIIILLMMHDRHFGSAAWSAHALGWLSVLVSFQCAAMHMNHAANLLKIIPDEDQKQ